MEKILISACLIGENCKYDGTNNQVDWIERLSKYYDLIPFCPEVAGGLPTPRVPSEIKNGVVKNKKGKDVTSNFNKGAELAYNICKHAGISLAILKENSPSCGVHSVYDGNFKGKLVNGSGVTATLLRSFGIKVISENEVESMLENLDFQKEKQIEGRKKNIEENPTNLVSLKEKPKKEEFKKKSFKTKKYNSEETEKTETTEEKKFVKKSFSKDRKFSGHKKFSKPFKKDGETSSNGEKHYSKGKRFNSKSSFKKPFARKSSSYKKTTKTDN